MLSAYSINPAVFYYLKVLSVEKIVQFTSLSTDSTSTVTGASSKKPTTSLTSLCPNVTSLHDPDESVYEGLACQPRPPSKKSCEYTAEKFKLMPSILTCKDQDEPPYNLCHLQDNTDLSTEVKVSCDLSVCDTEKDILIENPDPSDGKLRDQRIEKPDRRSNEKFATLVEKALFDARENNLNFIFLSCTRKGTENKTISQMISVLPKLQYTKPREKKPHAGKLNVNILLLDSISRAHFYRSFPKTIEYLQEKRVNKKPKSASFFEFQFFQAVHGNTHVTEKGLFSGDLYPANYTEGQVDKAPTNPQILYSIFKDNGYQTMYSEDQCYKGHHGLRDSFKAKSWKTFQYKLTHSNIDTTGEWINDNAFLECS